MLDSPYGENRHYWKGHFVRELSDELLDELLQRIVVLGRPPGGILIESLHDAHARLDECDCVMRLVLPLSQEAAQALLADLCEGRKEGSLSPAGKMLWENGYPPQIALAYPALRRLLP